VVTSQPGPEGPGDTREKAARAALAEYQERVLRWRDDPRPLDDLEKAGEIYQARMFELYQGREQWGRLAVALRHGANVVHFCLVCEQQCGI